MTALVLAPGVTFAEVAEAMAGWEGGPSDVTPELGGEPIAAHWRRNGLEVSYSANPALGLRVLAGSGLREVAALPASMTSDQALGLAQFGDTAGALLGVTALGLLDDPSTIPSLERIDTGAAADPALAGAAALAVRRIGLAGLAAGADRVAERRRRRPGQDPALGLLRPAWVRRQVLRGFLAERSHDRVRLLDVVRAGLADADWEVRWIAVLAAHDNGLPEVLPEIRRCSTPAEPDLRRVLDAVREVVGHRLVGTRARIPGAAHIEAVLDGTVAVEARDTAFLLVASLREPIADPAEDASPGLTSAFRQVPAVPHWLGHEAIGVRRVTPETYEIAASPRADVAREQITATLRELAREHGRPLRLPTPDELEMATRGCDGRRFPWGNAREPGWRRAPSPWRLSAPLLTAEWVDAGGVIRAAPEGRFGYGRGLVAADVAAVRAVPSA